MSFACDKCGVMTDTVPHTGCVSIPRPVVKEIRLPFKDLDLTRFGSRKDDCGMQVDAVVVAGVTIDDVTYCRLEEVTVHDDADRTLAEHTATWLLALNVGGHGPLWEQIADWVIEENRAEVERQYRGETNE